MSSEAPIKGIKINRSGISLNRKDIPSAPSHQTEVLQTNDGGILRLGIPVASKSAAEEVQFLSSHLQVSGLAPVRGKSLKTNDIMNGPSDASCSCDRSCPKASGCRSCGPCPRG